ncbi:MAG: hypothetical protein IAE99_10760 [Rhodothermales bacterium]|nr:hypothetical protein [Rhodothermales bacterium]
MSKWNGWASTPLYATIQVVLAAFVGLLGSVYSSELKTSWPLWWGTGGEMAPRVVWLFWAMLVGTGLLFWKAKWLDVREQKAVRELSRDLAAQQKEMAALLTTMPPPQFLEHFKLLYEKAAQAAMLALDDPAPKPDDLRKAIRQVLYHYAQTAEAYDGEAGRQGHTYHANLMRFAPIPKDPQARSDLRKRLSFNGGQDLSELKGSLEGIRSLSISTQQESAADETLAELWLPVPKVARREDLAKPWQVLPGAPRAYCPEDGYHDACLSIESMLQWCDDETELRPEAVRQLKRYFEEGEGKAIRSFVSARLPSPLSEASAEAQESAPAWGVVNLHRSTQGMLKDSLEAVAMFASVSFPFYVLLARLAERLDQIGSSKP